MLEKPSKTRRAERSRARGMHGVTAPIRGLHLAAEECTMLYKTDKNGALRVGRHGCSFLEKGDSLKLPSQRCNVLEQQQKWGEGREEARKQALSPSPLLLTLPRFVFSFLCVFYCSPYVRYLSARFNSRSFLAVFFFCFHRGSCFTKFILGRGCSQTGKQ